MLPLIKCDISHRDGTKIYHLPFDHHDRIAIDAERHEWYVQSVAEAETLGLQRARWWHGLGNKAMPQNLVLRR